MKKVELDCKVTDASGNVLKQESMTLANVKPGSLVKAGVFAMDISGIKNPEKLTFKISVKGTEFRNNWDFWVYTVNKLTDTGKVHITQSLDNSAREVLKKGGSVLLLTYGKVGKTKGAQVAIGFSSIFWNTAWTNNQPPHTLGILCDPKHPVFNDFPTEYHSNWQWWDPITHSQAMILSGFPAELKPLIQPIDTWFENRKLALAFESKTEGGRLLVCSIDLKDSLDQRPVSQQLFNSIIKYMNGDSFNPKTDVEISKIEELCDQ
jgi:hypothetical protein